MTEAGEDMEAEVWETTAAVMGRGGGRTQGQGKGEQGRGHEGETVEWKEEN
jgi:hypothetical protein